MFSGGVDSSVLASLAGKILPPDDPVDLINVSFSDSTEADTIRGIICNIHIGIVSSIALSAYTDVFQSPTFDNAVRISSAFARFHSICKLFAKSDFTKSLI